MSHVVATFELQVTLRSYKAEPVEGEMPIQPPTVADIERIATEALRSYKAIFGVDEINVFATRTDE